MTDMRSQPTPEGSTAPTNDEIYNQVLGTGSYYVRGLGYRITALSFSRSSRAEIYFICQAWLMEMQRQAAEDRQQAEQRTQKLTEHIDQYQQF